MSFPKLSVRNWNGEQWPESRVSLSTDEGRAVAINPRYVTINDSLDSFHHIAKCVNSHDELVSSLENLLSSLGGGKKHCEHDFDCVCATDRAKAILSKIHNT
jgi:hypothetical protein